jgi:hypothetical protein
VSWGPPWSKNKRAISSPRELTSTFSKIDLNQFGLRLACGRRKQRMEPIDTQRPGIANRLAMLQRPSDATNGSTP